MSIFDDKKSPSASEQSRTFFNAMRNHINKNGNSSGLAEGQVELAFSVGAESKHRELLDAVATQMRTNGAAIGQTIFGDAWSTFTPAQRKAARIMSSFGTDIVGYNNAATSISLENAGNVKIPQGRALFMAAPEAFDHRNVVDSVAASTVVNTLAARQDDFSEAFYPTVVLAPNEGNVKLSVENNYVFGDHIHTGDGSTPVAYGFGSVSIIDAIVHPKYLRDHSTKLVPIYNEGNEIFSSEVAPFTDPDVGYETGALAFTKFNLLAASQDEILNGNSNMDSTDQIDLDVRIDTLFLKLTKGSNSDIFPIRIKDVPGSNFAPFSAQTTSRVLTLSFNSDRIAIHGELKNVAGTASEVLKYLADPARADWSVYLNIGVTGQVDLETGNLGVNYVVPSISSIFRTVDAGEGMYDSVEVKGKAEVNEMKSYFDRIELVGYTIAANRTNLNRRTRGLLVRTDIYTETHFIPMSAPISALTPVTDTETLVDIEGPVRLCRARNSQRGVQKLIEYGEQLRNFRNNNDTRAPTAEIQGIGRIIMRTYFEEREVDMSKLVNSLESVNHTENINAALVNLIRQMATDAYYASNYGAAWSAMGKQGKPTLIIGTNPKIASYLKLQGDGDLVGPLFKTKVVSAWNSEIGNRIFIGFTCDDDDVCFKHGNFYYIPEIVSSLPKTTNNAQSMQLTVQNRNLHINHSPIQLRIVLNNFGDVFKQQVPMAIRQVD